MKNLLTLEVFLEEINEIASKLGLDKSFLSRDMNTGFSGGEKKKRDFYNYFF